MYLGSTLSNIWHRFQGELFPALAQEVDPLLETHKRFVAVLDVVKKVARTRTQYGEYVRGLGLDMAYHQQTSEKRITLGSSTDCVPVDYGVVGELMVVERFLSRKGSISVVIGLVTGVLKVVKCSGDRDEVGINRKTLECRSEFIGWVAACEGFAKPLHVGMAEGPGNALAQGVPTATRDEHPCGFID